MARKIITIAVGQCGNEIGNEYWNTISGEHGIGPDGMLAEGAIGLEDRKDIFFYQADDGRYIPRAVLVDLENRVIDVIRSEDFYNPENIFYTGDSSGAGNAWSRGYADGHKNSEAIFDIIRREVEVADSLQGFILTHSICGGTGSGFGSHILERLSDDYKKATKITYSVFPSLKEELVNVAPYNSILTMRRLIEHADATVVLDNTALASITKTRIIGSKTPEDIIDETDPTSMYNFKRKNFHDMNSLVSTVMAATTATIRFPSYSNNDLVSLLAPLVPTPSCHFLMTGYTPISLHTSQGGSRRTSVIDVMNRLLDKKNIMMDADMTEGVYMSILNVLQGDIDPTEIHTALRQVHENSSLRFIPWGPASLQLALARRSPFATNQSRVSGLMLANHTSIRGLFGRIANNANIMFRNKAFVNQLEKFEISKGHTDQELRESLEAIKSVCSEYEAAEKDDFLSPENQ